MAETLKPCPFCGGVSRRVPIRDGRQVFCWECAASGPPAFHGRADQPSAEQRAITAWNRRTTTEAETREAEK